MSNKNLISVIIPTFNRDKYLSRSIKSVINQDYENVEIIVVDDFSTDGTQKTVLNLAKIHNNIKYVKNERSKGVSGARNTGILNSKGHYICFLDSDDEFKKNHISIRYEFIDKNGVDLVFGNYKIFDDQKSVFLNNFFQKKTYLKSIRKRPVAHGFLLGESMCNYLVMENFFSLGTVMVDASIAKKNMLREDISYAEDRDFAIRIGFEKETKIGCIHVPTYIAHKHDSNLTYDNYENDLKKWDNLIKLYDSYLKSSMFEKEDHKNIIKQIKNVFRNQIICQRKYGKYRESFYSLFSSLKYNVCIEDLYDFFKCCFHLPFKKLFK